MLEKNEDITAHSVAGGIKLVKVFHKIRLAMGTPRSLLKSMRMCNV